MGFLYSRRSIFVINATDLGFLTEETIRSRFGFWLPEQEDGGEGGLRDVGLSEV